MQVQEQRDAQRQEKDELRKEKEETEQIRLLFEEERAELSAGLRKQREEGDALQSGWEQLAQAKRAAAAAREAEQEELARQTKQVLCPVVSGVVDGAVQCVVPPSKRSRLP